MKVPDMSLNSGRCRWDQLVRRTQENWSQQNVAWYSCCARELCCPIPAKCVQKALEWTKPILENSRSDFTNAGRSSSFSNRKFEKLLCVQQQTFGAANCLVRIRDLNYSNFYEKSRIGSFGGTYSRTRRQLPSCILFYNDIQRRLSCLHRRA